MKFKTKTELSIREKPSINSAKIGTIKSGYTIDVTEIKTVSEISKASGNKVIIPWGRCSKGWISTKSKYVSKVVPKVDYGKRVASAISPACEKILKNHPKHERGSYQYQGKKINCSVFVSYVLYKAGLLPKGVIVSHTTKGTHKASVGACVRHYKDVKHYEWHKVDCLYQNLPSKYKKVGAIGVQDSNIFIVGSDGLYACHSTGKTYTGLSMIRHRKGSYEYTHKVLAIGVPKCE